MATLKLTKGMLLVAEPFMKDEHFERSVILVCIHDTDGTTGLILNKPSGLFVKDVLLLHSKEQFSWGGPMERDNLFFLHNRPDLIQGGTEVIENLYMNGNYEQLAYAIEHEQIQSHEIRFFLGYAGWAPGQIRSEYTQKSWIVADANQELVMNTPAPHLWAKVLKAKGGNYKSLANYPSDPRNN
jgi:putative transcriptional regulator